MLRKVLQYIGDYTLNSLKVTSEYMAFTFKAIIKSLVNRKGKTVVSAIIIEQVYYTAVQIIPLISIILGIIGTVIYLASMILLGMWGASDSVEWLIVTLMFNEVTPAVVAIIITARSGTAICAQLGNMKVNKEIDLLRSTGIDPFHYVIFPRVIGITVSIMALCLVGNFVGLTGGFLASRFFEQATMHPLYILIDNIQIKNIGTMLLKSFLFGIIIGSVCSFIGMSVKKSYTEVPQKTSKSAITSIILLFIVSVLITVFLK